MKLTGRLAKWGTGEAAARHRLWRQTGTAAHLQTARLPFGLPIKTRRRSASTLLMQKMTSFISHYEQRLFKKRGHTKAAGCSFCLLHGGICIHWRKGRMKNSPHFRMLGHGGVAGRREKKERAIYFTICQLLKATSGIQTHNILISLQMILCLTCMLMSLCAPTRGVLVGEMCTLGRNRLADIWTKAFSLTGELVAVAGCESSVSAAICCHDIRVT